MNTQVDEVVWTETREQTKQRKKKSSGVAGIKYFIHHTVAFHPKRINDLTGRHLREILVALVPLLWCATPVKLFYGLNKFHFVSSHCAKLS